MESQVTINVAEDAPPSRPPPPPPPKRLSRPKITLTIPDKDLPRGPVTAQLPMSPRGAQAGPIYWGPSRYHGKAPPITPGSHVSDPHYYNPLMHMYHNKASDFMFKQFAGFKDFTMNTAKSGLSAGEKSAFWFYNKLRTLSKRWFTHFFLTLCLVLYSVMGAAIFMALEGTHEDKIHNATTMNISEIRRDIAMQINVVVKADIKSIPSVDLIEDLLKVYESNYTSCVEQSCDKKEKKKVWGFWNSMFYAGTIYTTIGYGHIAPKTTYGRVATIAYAIVGIPLFLIVLADFGKLFTRIIKFFWAFIRRFYYTRSCKKVRRTAPMQEMMKGLNIVYDVVRRPSQIFSEEDMHGVGDVERPPAIERKPSDAPPPLPPKPGQVIVKESDTEPDTPAPSLFEIDDEFNLPISVAIFILIVYIIIGATVYNFWENWNFFESFYFVFISMSTIGLGDLVPDHPIFMMASILYLVFGLALTSMCINVVQVKLSDTFKKASAKLGATIGLKVAEEDGSLIPITPPPTEEVPVHKPKSEREIEKSKADDEEGKKKS